ncbi:hypothetical protein PspLS_11638 [Pyricularia sp. CBS 133598]|nr:hypothetical protein PspLS_11638 [Pyricularia sp. CBS 133598]
MRTFSLLRILSLSSLLLNGASALGPSRSGHSDVGGQTLNPGSPRGAVPGVQVAKHGGSKVLKGPPKVGKELFHGSRRRPKDVERDGGLRVQAKPEDGAPPMTYKQHVQTSRHHILKGESKTEFISLEGNEKIAETMLTTYYPSYRRTFIYYVDTTGIEDQFENVEYLYNRDGKEYPYAEEEDEWITRKDIPGRQL